MKCRATTQCDNPTFLNFESKKHLLFGSTRPKSLLFQLFLHHLIRKALPVFQRHLHEILPWGEALHIQAFQSLALRANEAPLQVVELDLLGLHVGRVLQVEPVLGGVGVEQVRANAYFRFWTA